MMEIKPEKRIAVTTRQSADYYKQETRISPTTETVRKIYLEELENNGYIDKQDSELDKRLKIYWPIVDLRYSHTLRREEKIKKCGIESQSRNFLQYSRDSPA